MTYDDKKKKLQDTANQNDISTNAEYENEAELNNIEDKDGNPIDAIEQDQVPPAEDESSSGKVLKKIIKGDETDNDDLDEEDNHIS